MISPVNSQSSFSHRDAEIDTLLNRISTLDNAVRILDAHVGTARNDARPTCWATVVARMLAIRLGIPNAGEPMRFAWPRTIGRASVGAVPIAGVSTVGT